MRFFGTRPWARDGGVSSIDLVELVMELEEAFDVDIPDEVASEIFTVEDAIRCIHAAGIWTRCRERLEKLRRIKLLLVALLQSRSRLWPCATIASSEIEV